MKAIERQVPAAEDDSAARNRISDYIAADGFTIGDVYLFNKSDPKCPGGSSLWGVFDKCENGTVFLESCSRDCTVFDTWCRLPEKYRYCRLATRTEMRHYIFDRTWHESRKIMSRERTGNIWQYR